MRKKRVFIVVSAIIVIAIVINIVIGIYFYKLVIERGPKQFLQGNEDLQVSEESLEHFLHGDWIKWTESQAFETLNISSFDGIPLQAYYLGAEKTTNQTVIFAHGYLGRAFDMGLFGQYYYEELGFNILTPDLRGHGESGGDYIGFGWHDRMDLLDWIDLVISRNGPDSEIILHGLSMGAASVLMASGEVLPKQVKGIVADSPYTSVYDLFAYQMKRMYALPDQPVLPVTSFITKQKANYSFKEASALEQVKKASVPILYIHGEGDTFVPTRMAQELYDVTRTEKELVTFPKANHGEAVVLYEEQFFETVRSFVEKVTSHY